MAIGKRTARSRPGANLRALAVDPLSGTGEEDEVEDARAAAKEAEACHDTDHEIVDDTTHESRIDKVVIAGDVHGGLVSP